MNTAASKNRVLTLFLLVPDAFVGVGAGTLVVVIWTGCGYGLAPVDVCIG